VLNSTLEEIIGITSIRHNLTPHFKLVNLDRRYELAFIIAEHTA
jgi:hypothetical protein